MLTSDPPHCPSLTWCRPLTCRFLPPPHQDCVGSYTLIPYVVTATGRVLCGDAGLLRGLADGLVQAGVGTEALLTPLVGRLARLLESTPTDSW